MMRLQPRRPMDSEVNGHASTRGRPVECFRKSCALDGYSINTNLIVLRSYDDCDSGIVRDDFHSG